MPRLSKDQLADRSRYQFRDKEVEIPELGGSVLVKTLSVAERDALPDLSDAEGNSIATVEKLAELFVAVVNDPKLALDEAKAFLGDLPATAFDRVVEAFGELVGTKEAADKTVREFPQGK